MKLEFITLILILLAGISCENEDEEVFVPSTEWKEIKQGQKIPAGLHIRINLHTGKREAKLNEDDRASKKQVLAVAKEQEEGSTKRNVPFAELEEALKKITNSENPDLTKNLKSKFRSYEEIKKELGSIKLTPKSDAEVITELVKEYKNEMAGGKNSTKIKSILEDLEYLSHQIDNAIHFVNENGFNDIVYTSLNETNSEIKLMSLRLLSSLMQNNPQVQIHGLETGCIRELLKVLTLEKNKGIKYQAVGALSSILRRFPLAQKRFVENGGLSVITKVFEDGDTKMNVKLITLVVDLVNEHQLAEKNDVSREVLQQYELIYFEEKLSEHMWCKNVNKLLHTLVTTDEENHDFIEKCLRSMNILVKHCAASYDVKILNYLFQKYNKLALEDIDEDEEYSLSSYFSELKDLCDNLIKFNKVNEKTEL